MGLVKLHCRAGIAISSKVERNENAIYDLVQDVGGAGIEASAQAGAEAGTTPASTVLQRVVRAGNGNGAVSGNVRDCGVLLVRKRPVLGSRLYGGNQVWRYAPSVAGDIGR